MATILLIDDDELLHSSAETYLRSAGYDVVAVSSAMAGLDVLDSERKVDLALIDILMPKGEPHGVSFARMARMRRANLPIIFMTGYPDLADTESNLGGPLFAKPVDWPRLIEEIETQLHPTSPPSPV
jgi:CheY-like chemotaxis protein